MPHQSRHWCFTINNWTRDHEQQLEALGASATYLVFGYETASTGTPHLQGYIVFKNVKRFTTVQRLLPENAHIEAKQGSPKQAAEYCKKDGLYKEFGTPPYSNSTPFDRFCEWVLQEHNRTGSIPSEREVAQAFPALYVRYSKKLSDLARHLCPEPILQEGDLNDWQKDLYDMFDHEPDDRTIIFVPDEEGGKGKTWFQRYMQTKHPDKVQCLGIGKRDDIAHSIDENKSIFLFNVPRGGMEFLNYHVLEQLKDRLVYAPKYASRMKVMKNHPHVVVFSNESPDESKMTRDRYYIHTI